MDGLEDDETFGGLIDLNMSMQMSIDEDLTGTCNMEYLESAGRKRWKLIHHAADD